MQEQILKLFLGSGLANDLRLLISFGKLFSFGSSDSLITLRLTQEDQGEISLYKITEGCKRE